MDSRKRILPMLLPACGILVLILDSKTAMRGASEGIAMCIQSIIPSLFPFLMLSVLLTSTLVGQKLSIMTQIGKICGLPKNAEALFLIGLLGGYPVGAQVVADAYHSGNLTKNTAHRLLGFCSNAGPAFIFGIAGSLFSRPLISWFLWLIHIVSALIVGTVLPGKPENGMQAQKTHAITVQSAFKRSLHVMAAICGWIILFRVLITFFERWFLWLIPETAGILITGCLELANGIFSLQAVRSESVRFIICSLFLGFGGICVAMQTASVTLELGTGLYLPGKLLQAAISCALSAISARIIYGQFPYAVSIIAISAIASIALTIIFRKKKIAVAFSRTNMYNNRKSLRELPICSFGKK